MSEDEFLPPVMRRRPLTKEEIERQVEGDVLGVAGYAAEVRVTDPDTGGEKGAKEAVLGDICPLALEQLALVAGFGRRKYDRLNFLKGYAWSLSYDALQRHLMAFWSGEDYDPESSLHHLAHAAWHCLALLAFHLRGIGKDDRAIHL